MNTYWKNFIKTYISDTLYWYIPKGFTVKEENFESIRNKLKVLNKHNFKRFDKNLQTIIRKELIKKNLYIPKAKNQSEEDENAIVRVLKVVNTTLGLAWVNDSEKLHITEVGKKVLEDNNSYKEIIREQIHKFQFNKYKEYSIQVNPIYYLSKVIINLKDKYLTKDEYCLFIAKKMYNYDISKSIEEVERYRLLSDNSKNKIIEKIKSKKIPINKRKSIYETIFRNSTYAFNFFVSSNLFKLEKKSLNILDIQKLKTFIKENDKNNIWIEFREEKDWFYYYGKKKKKTAIEFALDYYRDISDVNNSINLFNFCKKNKISINNEILDKDFKSVLVDEKILEDFLERHLEELEEGLKLIGRQYPTITGPIDILANDKYGNIVVIELKKNRVADKVIGQISRYVTFFENEFEKQKIRAIIVGKNIDRNLEKSVKALKFQTDLYKFDYKVAFKKIN